MRKWKIFWQISRSGLAKTDGKYVEIPEAPRSGGVQLVHAEDGDIIAIIGRA